MKARVCEPRWKWSRISQFAYGRRKRFSPHASSRCSARENAILRGVNTFATCTSTISVRASGRMKGGYHIAGDNSTVSRVGLTAMKAMGVGVDSWGKNSMETKSPFGELLA